jgi:outer membrane cobalamin receptor
MKTILTILLILTANLIFAQRTVTGLITDKTNKPIEGVKIAVKDGNAKTFTDADGKYSITVPSDKRILEISKNGFKVQAVEIKSDAINLSLTSISDVDLFDMSLEDLMNIEVVSASNKNEKLSEAPATTIVITKEQIQNRGYKDMLEILQELPGIDMSVPYGDTYFKDYWRGYRNTIGSPYLFMIDGIEFNQLYFNYTFVMAAVPLSNIEQIEIVYGPASSVYGANAFMGVINIITKKDNEQETSFSGNLSGSVNGYVWADFNLFHKFGKTKVSLTSRFENGNLNQTINNNDFYWTQDKFLTDTSLWGKMINNPKVAGAFSSPVKNTGVDLRVYRGDLEMGAQFFQTYTGNGMTYPNDKTCPQSLWIMPEYSLYGRFTHKFTNNFTSTTTMRYRQSNLSNESQDLSAYNISNDGTDDMIIGGGTVVNPGETIRILQMTSWQTLNSSRSVFQNFEWNLNDKISFNTGLKYEDKNLQKSYDLQTGEMFFPDSIKTISDVYPPIPSASLVVGNRINWIERGVYLQGKYRIFENSIFNIGGRLDDNSAYGTSPTLRVGFIQKINNFNIKLLYGQAYQAPVPRVLYGNWLISGSDPNLKPEKSQTTEMDISFAKSSFNNNLSLWWVNNTNTIVSVTGGAKNLGERNIMGLDYLLQFNLPFLKKTSFQAYYSYIYKAKETVFDSNNNKSFENIGDLSHHKIHFGLTSYILKNLVINFKGQYRSELETVSTNPIRNVSGYFILDGNLTWTDFAVKGIGLSLKVTNLFDTKYFNPGIRSANSGDTGGTWNGRAWDGSNGWYNSLLPQPRRCIILSLNYKI